MLDRSSDQVTVVPAGLGIYESSRHIIHLIFRHPCEQDKWRYPHFAVWETEARRGAGPNFRGADRVESNWSQWQLHCPKNNFNQVLLPFSSSSALSPPCMTARPEFCPRVWDSRERREMHDCLRDALDMSHWSVQYTVLHFGKGLISILQDRQKPISRKIHPNTRKEMQKNTCSFLFACLGWQSYMIKTRFALAETPQFGLFLYKRNGPLDPNPIQVSHKPQWCRIRPDITNVLGRLSTIIFQLIL